MFDRVTDCDRREQLLTRYSQPDTIWAHGPYGPSLQIPLAEWIKRRNLATYVRSDGEKERRTTS
jgi:hypothetical protein